MSSHEQLGLMADVAAPPTAVASVLGAVAGAVMTLKGWLDAHRLSVAMSATEFSAAQQSSETWSQRGIVTTVVSVALGGLTCAYMMWRNRNIP